MILVIGLGNPLCGDEGVGKFVVDSVRQCFPMGKTKTGETLTAIARHQPSPDLTDAINDADKVLFVNTEFSDLSGKVICRSLVDPPQARPYTHDLTPAALLESVRVLYGRSPEATLVSLTSSHFDYGQGLSRATLSALPGLLGLLFSLVEVKRVVSYVSHTSRQNAQRFLMDI